VWLPAIADIFRNSAQQIDASGIRVDGGLSMTNPRPLAGAKTYIRGTPDCDWGIPAATPCDARLCLFREHCIERHGLDPDDTERICWFNLEALTMTLVED